jgi:hypothetical protein
MRPIVSNLDNPCGEKRQRGEEGYAEEVSAGFISPRFFYSEVNGGLVENLFRYRVVGLLSL